MENKTIWIVENQWNSDDGPAVNIQVCATQETAVKVFATTVADEIEFWRNDLNLPITEEMITHGGGFYEYDYEAEKFTLCNDCYREDFLIITEHNHFELNDFMSYRSTTITLYAQTLIE